MLFNLKQRAETLMPVKAVNRLDRLTSGVMVCSLTSDYSKELGAYFQGTRRDGDTVKKEYVARVLGRFPESVIRFALR